MSKRIKKTSGGGGKHLASLIGNRRKTRKISHKTSREGEVPLVLL